MYQPLKADTTDLELDMSNSRYTSSRTPLANAPSSSSSSSRLGQNAELADMIQNLQKKNMQLERFIAKLGTKAETPEMRERVSQMRQEGKRLCEQIILGLKDSRGDVLIRKRLSSDFQQALEKFTQINQDIERKEELVVRRMSSSQNQDSNLVEQQLTQEEQQIDIQFQAYDVEAIRQRTDGIKKIERDVLELHEMFQDLKLLVDEQQESIDTIEKNVVDARMQTEKGHEELIQAEEYQKKARKKQCCILFLVLIVLVAVVLGVVFIVKR